AYEHLPAENMLAFFLKTFGEGITRTYLQPYNEKIWKFDPSMMNTEMVERIPKPPAQDIVNSAKGIFSEGYLHQLHFTYPRKGGVQSIVNGVVELLQKKGVRLVSDNPILKIEKADGQWNVKTGKEMHSFDRIVNCMPIHELFKVMPSPPVDILQHLQNLKYNSIYIVIVNVKGDILKNSFATTIPEKDILFHRLSRLDFMGEQYHLKDSTTLMLEITFRKGDAVSRMTNDEVVNRCISDLEKLKFIKSKKHVNFTKIRKEKYAYVIYDLDHRGNIKPVLEYLEQAGIESVGRFARFEYVNMDKVIEHSMELAKKFNAS
ncbi:MAG: FAD-dependent oxidoreductase, partial [Candidatus Shapirobacteria bacterium]